MLLLESGRMVSVDRLVELLWDQDPPDGARRAVHAHVARLRAALAAVPAADPPRILTAGAGYVVHAAPDSVDADRFRSLVLAARAEGTARRRAALLRGALALWRGPALADIATDRFRDLVCGDLEELRLLTLEDCFAAELDIGCHAELVAELRGFASAHPYRERIRALLMLALYRAGRQVEALETFRSTRAQLVDQLGVEPTAQLQRLHEVMLQGDGRLTQIAAADLHELGVAGVLAVKPPEPRPQLPRELPADVSGFAGRVDALRALDEMLPDGPAAAAVPLVVSAITGTGGVGKTALAVHWAHRVVHGFPDGQLYINLRGYASGAPLRPVQALSTLLRSLGVPPEQVPAAQADAAALYRSVLAGKRMLVLLDNARSAEQVRPLLPGSPGCLVLVTSRDRLSGLVARDGARRLTLDVLTAGEALVLLTRILGDVRVRAEPEAAAELARLCAHLPLALRVAAANLVDRVQLGIGDQVDRLREGNRLAALVADGDRQTAVAATFHLSYRTVPAAAQRLFRLLGLVPGPDVTVDAAAALAAITRDEAAGLLDRLAAAHLIQEQPAGRYTFHDLLRLFARQRAHRQEPQAQRQAAMARLCDWYLHGAAAAGQLYTPRLRLPIPLAPSTLALPRFADHRQASNWLDAERPNLVAVCIAAAQHGPRHVAWLIADSLRGYMIRRMPIVDWLAIAEAGLSAATAEAEQRPMAAAHRCLGIARFHMGRHRDALEHFNHALRISRQDGWVEGLACSLDDLGLTYRHAGQLDEAVEMFSQSIAHRRRIDQLCPAPLTNLGCAHEEAGRLREATGCFTDALAQYREIGPLATEAAGLNNLGRVYRLQGWPGRAAGLITEALLKYRDAGMRSGEASALSLLACLHLDAGRLCQAADCAQAALDAVRGAPDAEAEIKVLNALAAVRRGQGDCAAALHLHQTALGTARNFQFPYGIAETHIGLAITHHNMGSDQDALQHVQHALDRVRAPGFRVLEGQALTVLCDIHRALGDPGKAATTAEAAVAIHRETGYRPGEARALTILGNARRDLGDVAEARSHWRTANNLVAHHEHPRTG
ncbi:MAG: hypothetical protein V7603_5521 [Micromonosporaceae bacterium]